MKSVKLWREAFGNLFLHKTRSFLAALGIIFGVAPDRRTLRREPDGYW